MKHSHEEGIRGPHRKDFTMRLKAKKEKQIDNPHLFCFGSGLSHFQTA
jgi:hypothetical protein